MTIYNYHINLYKLYEANLVAWYSNEAENVIKPSSISYLRKKGFIKCIKRSTAEEMRQELKKLKNFNYVFWTFSNEGLKIAEYLKENPGLMARMLLEK